MTDNELLEQFFRPAKELRIDDDGFTERVMSRLPQRDAARLSNLWTAFCIMVAVVLFILLRGWEPIVKGVFTLMTTPLSLHMQGPGDPTASPSLAGHLTCHLLR